MEKKSKKVKERAEEKREAEDLRVTMREIEMQSKKTREKTMAIPTNRAWKNQVSRVAKKTAREADQTNGGWTRQITQLLRART